MKKLLFLAALLSCQMMSAAKGLAKSDTVWMNDEYEKVTANIATIMGVVQEVDAETKELTIECYAREDLRLLSTQHRTFSMYGLGMKIGRQTFYAEDGSVQSTEEYVPYTDLQGRKLSRQISEILLNPDGSVSEEVTFKYKKAQTGERQFYVRQCYYPDGKLQYTETMNEKGCKTQYYNVNGKKDKHPEQLFAPYLTLPEFPGGNKKLFEYLNENVKYPDAARVNGIQGNVIVQFTVDKDGAIGDVTLARPAGDPTLNREAVRVVNTMPRWIPGTKRGKPVRVRYTLPVNFRLQ